MAEPPVHKAVERVISMPESSSRSSSRSSAFSNSTKEALGRLNGACWACNSGRPLNCAHVVPENDEEIEYLKSLGLLPCEIEKLENGMRLCSSCHNLFDDMLNPGWIFVSADLDYFIDYELEDRQARLQSRSIRGRTVPGRPEYLQYQIRTGTQPAGAAMPTYTRYPMGSEQWRNSRFVTGNKEWHGHPLAAIRMAWRVLGAVRNNEIPVDVREKLSRLLDLYRTPLDQGQHQPAAPPPNNPSRSGEGGDGDEDEDGGTNKRKAKGLSETGPGQSKRRPPPPIKKTQAAERPKRQNAGKRRHVLMNVPAQPLYDSDDEIIKWVQAVEPERGLRLITGKN